MDLKTYCDQNRGAQARIAELLGVDSAQVNQWVRGRRSIPAIRAVKIEHATGGVVRRWTMRKDWADLWPDLVGAPGAPDVAEARHAA
jgi:DNA-binding transcriptional regulator YdaS (Cro superfamily)